MNNTFLNNLGVIVILLGALALIIPTFAGFGSNVTLIIGGVLMLAGLIIHIIMTRKSTDL